MRIIKRCLVGLLVIASAAFLGLFAKAPSVFAEENYEDAIRSVILSYGDDETIDVYRNSYTVSIDDNINLILNFNLSDQANKVFIRNIHENGATKTVCETTTKSCTIPVTNLYANSGLQIAITDSNNDVIRKTMLGVVVKQNATKEQYEQPISIGPGSGISIDMSSVAPGMRFTLNHFTIPIKYEHYPDGRSVIGLGTNSTDEKFWEDAAKDGLEERMASSDLYAKWKEENKHQTTGGSLGLTWTVAGYATSYDDKPDQMTGTIQFFVGSGYSLTGQYAIFTYTVTISWGATGDFSMTLVPSADMDHRVKGNFDLALSAGLELYGGIGSGYFASVGIYGKAGIGTAMNVLPEFHLNSLYVSGEVGLKAKVLGRDVLTFTFTKGTKDFLENTTNDGTTEYSLEGPSFKDTMTAARNELIADNYGTKQAGEIELPEGETTWDLENLDVPTEDDSLLQTNENGTTFGDRSYAHRIAENVYAHSGTQIIHGQMDTLKAIAVFAANSGELNYSVYDGFYQQMSEPQKVAGTGQDFNARFIRGNYSDQSYLVWQRLGNNGSNATLTQVAESGDIKIARYNYNGGGFTGFESVTENSSEIYGDLGVAVGYGLDAQPYVFAYTNPSYDPTGLSDYSNHTILVFHKSGDTWVREEIGNFTGIISTFDAGRYDGIEAAAFTLESGSGSIKTTYVISKDGNEIVHFDNAWGAQFVMDLEEPVLVFMQDGKLYSSISERYTERRFGDDEHKLPEAPFSIVGDPSSTFMVAYLASVDARQNLIGYTNAGGSASYEPIVLTNVGENSNVTYASGVFLGPNFLPFIIYTVQNYEHVAGLWWEDRQADMYALAGAATNHVLVASAEVTNLKDLAVTTDTAKVSIMVRNNGLFRLSEFSLYYKNEGESDDKYVKLGDYNVGTMQPGDIKIIEIELPESDYTQPHSYVIGATCRNDIGIQSDKIAEITEGPVYIDAEDYDFRTRQKADTYVATIKSLGPGFKSGEVVFYDRTNMKVYLRQSFTGLAPGETKTFKIMKMDSMLSSSASNLAVRVLKDGETFDEARPTNRYRQVELLPAWFGDYLNQVGSAHAYDLDGEGIIYDEESSDEKESKAPETGLFSAIPNNVLIIVGVVAAVGVVACSIILVRERAKKI